MTPRPPKHLERRCSPDRRSCAPALALLRAACGGKSLESSRQEGGTESGFERDQAPARAASTRPASPCRGGKLIYGARGRDQRRLLPARGPAGHLRDHGRRAIYDTLTVPNAKGEYVPYLAKSVTHNADYTDWTITLRDGIKFHDGTAARPPRS